MSVEKILILSGIAFITTFLVTPWSRKLATRFGMVDRPGERKIHTQDVPYGGGVAIFIGFLVGLLFLNRLNPEIAAYLAGGVIIFSLGIVDDLIGLKALPKFFVQSLVAFLLIYSGIRIDMELILRGQLAEFSYLSIPLTYLWIVGITNAINIIDGLDGLAAGVSTISAFTISAVAFTNGQTTFAVIGLIVGFAALGFLPHNFNTKIFMGDSGSMFLGYSLAVISIMASVKLAAAFSLAVPILILAIPIFDTAFAIIRRLINRQPIGLGDKKHLHHRLLELGFSPTETVIIIYVLSIFFGGLALYSTTVRARTGLIVFASSLAIILLLGAGFTLFSPKKLKR